MKYNSIRTGMWYKGKETNALLKHILSNWFWHVQVEIMNVNQCSLLKKSVHLQILWEGGIIWLTYLVLWTHES